MIADGPVLRDIHLPPAGWWPLAPGWWGVAALVVLVACMVVWLFWRRSRQRTRRAALREINSLAAAYARDGDMARLAEGASRLLRRVARLVDPDAASLSGDAWRSFLHRYAHDAETQEALDRLVATRYLAHPVVEAPALLAALRGWCRNALPGGRRNRAVQSETKRTARGGAQPASGGTAL
jgi:hypothetical protein